MSFHFHFLPGRGLMHSLENANLDVNSRKAEKGDKEEHKSGRKDNWIMNFRIEHSKAFGSNGLRRSHGQADSFRARR